MKSSQIFYSFVTMFIIVGYTSIAQNPIPPSERIPDLNYFIVPGTMSVRLDNSANPAIAPSSGNYKTPDYYVRGHYFNYDNGGGRTGWNSSQYLDFTFFQHPTNPNWITDPHQVDSLPFSGNNGYNYSGSIPKWLGLNYRIAYPSSSYYNVDTTSKETLYPLILFMHGAGERADCWNNNCYNDDGITTNNNTGLKNLWNNDHNIVHGGKQHLDAINRNPSDPRHWPGYVVVPQNKNGYNPGPGLETWTGRVIALVEQLIKDYPIDPNKIYIHGLSEGAQGSWMLIQSRPDLFAASAPMSGHRDNGAFSNDFISMDTSMIHIPIWQFQGGRDNRPSPEGTGNKLNKLRNQGGTPRYTIYPNLGHGVWNTAYAEPDFFSWFLQHSKLTIHSYYGVNEVCEGDPVNVRLGISKYFEDYEWRKTTDGGITYSAIAPSVERDNEIIADELGSYQVRIMRNGVWSDWSDPYTITSKPRPSALISAVGSTALTALDGATNVILATEEDGIYYEWFKNGSPYLEDSTISKITVSDPGAYTLIKKDIGLCNSFESNALYVSQQPYSGITPVAPTNAYAAAASENSINLFWQDESDNELGFEVYRSTDNVNYQWVTTTSPDLLMFNDQMLNGQTQYYYKVRAYNANGASPASNVVTVTTAADTQNPTSPLTFKFDHFGYRETRINIDGNDDADEYFEVRNDSLVFTWAPSTDNVGIDHYEIYFGDGTLATTTTDTIASVDNLNLNSSYNFYAIAIDNNGNASNPSSLEAVTTTMDGLYYNLYAGGTWDIIREFSNWALFDDGFGSTSSFDIYGPKSGKYSDNNYFAYEFFGYIYIETAGTYTFYTNSDDGSKLWIGSTEVVDNDGLHGGQWREGDIYLSEGAHPITVQFFERSGGEGLTVSWAVPGGSRTNIPSNVLRSGPLTTPNPPAAPTNLLATAHETEFQVDLTWDFDATDIVVIGSSTAAGYGLGTDKSWVEKLDSVLTTDNADYSLTNLAQNGGYTTYHVRATGKDGGGYANAPNPLYNITHALSLTPDIIIVNLPSNNVADNIDIATTIGHYQELKTLADAAGVEIFFTTTQPRDFNTNSTKRHLLEDEANAVRSNFGQYVIDIYDELTDFGNDNRIKTGYAQGDGTHLNVSGHNYILSEVLDIVGQHMPKFEVYQSEAGGAFSIINTTSYAAPAHSSTNLLPSTNYTYKVKTVNIFGSSSDSNTTSATTTADTDPPTQPQNLEVRSKTTSKITLSWDNSIDNIGVTEYLIEYFETSEGNSSGREEKSTNSKSEAQSITSMSNGISVDNLIPNTNYTFTVMAVDASSNQSLGSAPLSASTDSNGALPIELISFNYAIKNDQVFLNWKTASETNNSHFEIERGFEVSDFSKLGQVQGAGTTNDSHVYEYIDKSPKTSNFYRIKQVDFDGKSSYSDILRVEVKIDPFEDLILYPNPTSAGNINIIGRAKIETERIFINFTDLVGKNHLTLETDQDSIVNGITINLSEKLRSGIYMISISDGIRTSRKKLVIK